MVSRLLCCTSYQVPDSDDDDDGNDDDDHHDVGDDDFKIFFARRVIPKTLAKEVNLQKLGQVVIARDCKNCSSPNKTPKLVKIACLRQHGQ